MCGVTWHLVIHVHAIDSGHTIALLQLMKSNRYMDGQLLSLKYLLTVRTSLTRIGYIAVLHEQRMVLKTVPAQRQYRWQSFWIAPWIPCSRSTSYVSYQYRHLAATERVVFPDVEISTSVLFVVLTTRSAIQIFGKSTSKIPSAHISKAVQIRHYHPRHVMKHC